MQPCYSLQRNAEKQIIEKISNTFSATDNVDGQLIFRELQQDGFIKISPPQEEPLKLQMITINSLNRFDFGNSIKPGNITLNLKSLVNAVPGVIEAVAGSYTDMPILKVCAALNIWKAIRNILTIEINKEQAFVIIALWKNCDSTHRIDADHGHLVTNKLLSQYGEPEMSKIKYNKVIDSLTELRCIELNENIIRLIEWIRKSYIDSI